MEEERTMNKKLEHALGCLKAVDEESNYAGVMGSIRSRSLIKRAIRYLEQYHKEIEQ